MAIGSYMDGSGTPQEMVLSQLDGVWTAASELARSSASASVELSALACRTASSCVAVGSVQSASGSWHPAVVNETAGSWGPAIQIALPASASRARSATFSSLACPASGSCTVVGYYELEAGGGSLAAHAILDAESAGVWGAASAIALRPRPAGVRGEQLKSVACPAPGACVAVGSYEDRYGDDLPIAIHQSDGAWGAVTPIVRPPDAGGGADTSLEAVACPGSGSCVASASTTRGGAAAPMAAEKSGSQCARHRDQSPLGAGSGPGPLEAAGLGVVSDAPILSGGSGRNHPEHAQR